MCSEWNYERATCALSLCYQITLNLDINWNDVLSNELVPISIAVQSVQHTILIIMTGNTLMHSETTLTLFNVKKSIM